MINYFEEYLSAKNEVRSLLNQLEYKEKQLEDQRQRFKRETKQLRIQNTLYLESIATIQAMKTSPEPISLTYNNSDWQTFIKEMHNEEL